MGILNLFKGKKQKNDETNVASQKDVRKEMSLAECVELMFRNAVIRPHVDGNKYLTEVQARHCVFTPVLVVEGNRLIIMVRFPAPVPEQFAYSVNYEMERINGMYRDAEVTLSHNDDGDFTIYSMIIKEYDSVSAETADEIRRLMVHAVDVLDEDNFRSLLCSLIGHRDYSELEARMIEGNTAGGRGTGSDSWRLCPSVEGVRGHQLPSVSGTSACLCDGHHREENLQGGRQRSADEADSVR